MPENERRTQILDAVERLLGRGGIDAVTMRAVAAEAHVSLRLVQYYGISKDALLTAALTRLADRSVERWQARADDQTVRGPVMAQLRSFLLEALPTDAASRSFHRVGVSLELLAITQSEPVAQAYQAHLGALAVHLSEVIAANTRLDRVQARHVALELMSFAHGLGTLLMSGQTTAADAEVIIQDYLDRLRLWLGTGSFTTGG